MKVLEVSIRNFRNISAASVEFSPGFTLILGANGQGKTNTLEALYYTTCLKPLRSVTRKHLLRNQQEPSEVAVQCQVKSTGLQHDLTVQLSPQSRKLIKDGKACTPRNYLGLCTMVSFCPDDLSLLKGSPEGRRKFIDRALFNLFPGYLDTTLRYQKALRDRNRLLQEGSDPITLEAFDQILIHEGAEILFRRYAVLNTLRPIVESTFMQIATPAPSLALNYAASAEINDRESPEAIAHELESALVASRPRDRARGATSVGPHRDDLELTLDGHSAKEWASQGQHRALALSLKLAELKNLAAHQGEAPILLLDDMSSELDAERSAQLFEAIRELGVQVVLSSTEQADALATRLQTDDLAAYSVTDGELERMR